MSTHYQELRSVDTALLLYILTPSYDLVHAKAELVLILPQLSPALVAYCLTRNLKAFPGGRPSFCISLDKYGPYDFASYVRIATGLPAFPEPPLDTGEPYSGREVDETSCQRSTEEGSAERSVHERWEILRHDPQGLAAVVAYLETRLSKYPRSLVWGGDGGRGGCGSGDGCSCGGSGGENVWAATENGGDACGAMTAQGESRVSCERRCRRHDKARNV